MSPMAEKCFANREISRNIVTKITQKCPIIPYFEGMFFSIKRDKTANNKS